MAATEKMSDPVSDSYRVDDLSRVVTRHPLTPMLTTQERAIFRERIMAEASGFGGLSGFLCSRPRSAVVLCSSDLTDQGNIHRLGRPLTLSATCPVPFVVSPAATC